MGIRGAIRVAVLAGAVLLLAPTAAQPTQPGDVAGLVAWYDARSLYDKLRDGASVGRWPDRSGNGHDLVEEGNGLASTFRTLRVNEKPAVKIGKGSSFAVNAPFELQDHTIFLVYRSAAPTMALFSALKNDQRGVIVAKNKQQHLIHSGTNDWNYNSGGVGTDFSITVLMRESGRLRAFVNGLDVSGSDGTDVALEVGRLFHAALSRAVGQDAEKMWVADLIFYERALTGTERRGVTEFLAEKYALELSEPANPGIRSAVAFDWSGVDPQASLSSTGDRDLNVDRRFLIWDGEERATAPFRHDPEQPTRLYCDRDARIHLSLRLRMRTTEPGSRLRFLALRNASEYLNAEGVTEKDPEVDRELIARLDVSLDVSAGDWIEFVVEPAGAPGTVTLVPAPSRLLAVAE